MRGKSSISNTLKNNFSHLPSVRVKVKALYFEWELCIIVAEGGAVDGEGGPVGVEVIVHHGRLAYRCEAESTSINKLLLIRPFLKLRRNLVFGCVNVFVPTI